LCRLRENDREGKLVDWHVAGPWRKEFGGLKVDQAKRMKEMEQENAKSKRLVAELSLETQILKGVVSGNF
jgi:hypothetical protein